MLIKNVWNFYGKEWEFLLKFIKENKYLESYFMFLNGKSLYIKGVSF